MSEYVEPGDGASELIRIKGLVDLLDANGSVQANRQSKINRLVWELFIAISESVGHWEDWPDDYTQQLDTCADLAGANLGHLLQQIEGVDHETA